MVTTNLDYTKMEQYLSEQIQKEAPDEVAEFIDELKQDGISNEEVDELRQLVLAALQDSKKSKALTTYLVKNDLMDEEDIPKPMEYQFLLTLLGMVGAAQSVVQQGI